MAVHLDQIVKRRAAGCQKLMVDRLEMLTIDEQTRSGKKVMDVGDPPGDGIFHRHHGQRGTAFLNGQNHVLKG